jgi:hypothetical protein
MDLPAEKIKQLKTVADNELNNPQWGLTQQFLEVNIIKKINNEYMHERHQIENVTFKYYNEGMGKLPILENYYEIRFYYEVENENYFFCIGVDINNYNITRVYMVNGCYCYLTATSEELSLNQLAELTKLKYTDGWSKGDKKRNGSIFSFSRISFEYYDKKSYELEEALLFLLDELEKDKNGVIELTKKSNAYISVCKHQYISGNASIAIDINTINRLNELNLGIDIDMYITGKKFKE